MKKNKILLTLVFLGSFQVTAGADTRAAICIDAIKKAASYLFSSVGATDLALACCLDMGLTTIHELGHAVTAKILYGAPVQLVLGTDTRHNNRAYFKKGGITIGGLRSSTGYTIYTPTGNHADRPLKEIFIRAAGPVCGALSSMASLLLLQKWESLYITKVVALCALLDHTIGINGVGGIWQPGTDAHSVVENLKDYLAH